MRETYDGKTIVKFDKKEYRRLQMCDEETPRVQQSSGTRHERRRRRRRGFRSNVVVPITTTESDTPHTTTASREDEEQPQYANNVQVQYYDHNLVLCHATEFIQSAKSHLYTTSYSTYHLGDGYTYIPW